MHPVNSMCGWENPSYFDAQSDGRQCSQVGLRKQMGMKMGIPLMMILAKLTSELIYINYNNGELNSNDMIFFSQPTLTSARKKRNTEYTNTHTQIWGFFVERIKVLL